MAILKIARMGQPVLAQQAEEIDDPTAPQIAALVRDMIDTLADAEGIGLAAPQIHVPLRLVILHIPPHRLAREGEVGEGEKLTVMINPEIEPESDEWNLGWESCLSVPGMTGEVPRYSQINYRYRNLAGEPVERLAEGFHARVIQHECDHLDGILYPMRMDDLTLFGFQEEIDRARRLAGGDGPDETDLEDAADD